EGVDPGRVLDSTSVQELGDVPAHLVVLGGGAVGVEFGQLFRRFGARVTIVQRGERLLGRGEDPELAACLEGILREDGIEVLLGTAAGGVETAGGGGDEALPLRLRAVGVKTRTTRDIHASHLLVATGRVPNTETLGLQAAGIQTSESGHVVASPTLETNVPGVYVLGDVKGGPAFTHVSYDDFRIVRDNLARDREASSPAAEPKTTHARAACIPSVVYTDPQVAHVGPKWGDLAASPRAASGPQLVSYAMPGSWIARGLETDETRGMMKAVVEAETGRIVSFAAIGPEAGEVMAVVQMAMLGGVRWEGLRDAVWAHPSWSESLNNLWGGERRVIEF
ncbi:FAD/NAD(P)-binding domain-containing protein, partial [Melanomma pulvis-pyrius CBS 109.77]